MSKSTFSEFWRLTKDLKQSEDQFIQGKLLNLNTVSFVVFYFALFPFTSSIFVVALKTNSLTIMVVVKPAACSHWKGLTCLKLPKSPNSRELLLNLSGSFPSNLHLQSLSSKTWLRPCSIKTAFSLRHLSKTVSGHHLTFWLPVLLTRAGTNKKLTLKT